MIVMTTDVPLTEQLRAITHDRRVGVAMGPMFKASVGAIPVASYIELLQMLAVAYDHIEQACTSALAPELAAVWDDSMRMRSIIEHDLNVLNASATPERPGIALGLLILSIYLERRSAHEPVTLLGYLYALLSGPWATDIPEANLPEALREPGTESSYVTTAKRWFNDHWQHFAERMNATPIAAHDQKRVVEAASEAYETIKPIIEALHPATRNIEQQLRHLTLWLNPQAGNHPIPNDLREIAAAMRAGERSWDEFPYYDWRYASRGRRFTWSDSAWLTTLADLSQEAVYQQIDWLGRVLASRGMPRWMLERHLEVLHEELELAIPERHTDYDKLLRASIRLKRQRRTYLSDDLLEALGAAFTARVGAEWSTRFEGAGSLLAAAVADERAGIPHAVTSMKGWMTDPSRFPQHWIDAVDETIREARARMDIQT